MHSSPNTQKAPIAVVAKLGREEGKTEISIPLEQEGISMTTTLQPEQQENHTKSRLSTAIYQRAIRQRVDASLFSYKVLSIMTSIPLDELASKLHSTECAFTVGEVAEIARVLGIDTSTLITPLDPEPETLTCVRKVCSVRHHQQFEDGRQGDMCRIDGIDSHKDLWDVFALSNGVGERWDAAIDLSGCDDLEGETGITIMREALAAFTKAQAYCNTLNESEGLN